VNTQLPDFEQSPAAVVAEDALAVAMGLGACATFDQGVKCWGPDNDAGTLGYGDQAPRGDQHVPSPALAEATPVDLGNVGVIVALSVDSCACATFDDGRVKCWGANDAGALGLGDTEHRGDEPGEMGDALPYVDLGADARVVDLDTYQGTTCAVLDDGRLKCWGYNGDWELGLGDTEARGDEPGEMGDALPAVDLGTGRRAIGVSVGERHACAVLEGGKLKCWGRNHVLIPESSTPDKPVAAGRLGYEDTRHRGTAPEEMGDALPFVDLGTDKRVIAVDAGFEHTCALLDTGEVKCWGAQGSGAIDGPQAFGIHDDIGDEPGEMGDALPAYDFGERRALVLAGFHSSNCALLDDGAVHCWGSSHELDWPIVMP